MKFLTKKDLENIMEVINIQGGIISKLENKIVLLERLLGGNIDEHTL